MMRSICKPPLARSPIRLRTRRVLQSNSKSTQTPPGSLTKSQKPRRVMDTEELELRPEYQTISYELRALAKMVQKEFGNEDGENDVFASGTNDRRGSLFERGKFYDEYAARRNERLRSKKGESGEEKKQVYGLGVRVDSVKRRGEVKKYESVRKTIPSTPILERRGVGGGGGGGGGGGVEAATPRYSLRSASSKKLVSSTTTTSSGIGVRKSIARVRKI